MTLGLVFKMGKNFRIITLLIALTFGFIKVTYAADEPAQLSRSLHAEIPFPVSNLDTTEKAESFALEITSRYAKQAKENGIPIEESDPILIFHTGETPPPSLQWVMLHLEAAHIPHELVLMKEEEFLAAFNEPLDLSLQTQAITYRHTYIARPHEPQPRLSNEDLRKRAKLFLKRLFGLPQGFTTWVQVPRSKRLKFIEGGLATVSSILAGASVTFTFYLTERRSGVPANEFAAGFFVAACVWYFLYEARSFSYFMGQAKVIKEPQPSQFKATESLVFRLTATAIRSFLTNCVVIAAAYGTNALFQPGFVQLNLINTVVTMMARVAVDDWLWTKLPTITFNGEIKQDPEKGHFKLAHWIALNSFWNIAFGFGKTISLLGLGTWADHAYYFMGAVGAAKLLWNERFTLLRKMKSLWRALYQKETAHYCVSALLMNSN